MIHSRPEIIHSRPEMIHTHQTAPTQFVEANGIRFAYRRFGNAAGVPLVFNQHFTGTMDHWDPAVTDGFANDREVILFNNAGISSSSGEVPTSIEGMAGNAIAFIGALGLSKVDVLGFSIGGFVAQEIAGQAPSLVRKLILVGTGPRGGEGMANLTPEAQQIFGAATKNPTTSGSPSISPGRKQDRRPAATSSSGFACAKRTGTPRSTNRWRPRNSKRWANGAFGSKGRTTT
jgi:pimeloyl-ACP methyl ester carboxylesterase